MTKDEAIEAIAKGIIKRPEVALELTEPLLEIAEGDGGDHKKWEAKISHWLRKAMA